MVAKRGVMFELQTSAASDAGKAFDELGKHVSNLEKRFAGLKVPSGVFSQMESQIDRLAERWREFDKLANATGPASRDVPASTRQSSAPREPYRGAPSTPRGPVGFAGAERNEPGLREPPGPNGASNGNGASPNGNGTLTRASQTGDDDHITKATQRRSASTRQEAAEVARLQRQKQDGWRQLSSAGKQAFDNQTAFSRGLANIDAQRAREAKTAADNAVADAKRVQQARQNAWKNLSGQGRQALQGQRSGNKFQAGLANIANQKRVDEARAQRERDEADRDIARLQKAADREQRQEAVRKARDLQGVGRRNARDVDDFLKTRDQQEAAKLKAGNKQLATLVKSGPQAVAQDQRQQERALRDYQRGRKQEEREAEISAARQREAQQQARESIISTTDAVTRLGEGFAYLGLIGQRDLSELSDRLLAIRGTAESIRGGMQLFGHFGRGGAVGRMLHGMGRGHGAGRTAPEAHDPGSHDSLLSSVLPRAVSDAALRSAGRIGAGAFAAPAGLIVGGVAAALALAVDQAAGGRFTGALGRSMGHRAIGLSQGIHSVGNILETAGMDVGERQQVEYRRRTEMEDVNHPRGWGLGVFMSAPGAVLRGDPTYRGGLSRDVDAAAASARNAERMKDIANRQAEQRRLRHEIEGAQFSGDLQQGSLRREQEDGTAANRRPLRAAQLRAKTTEYYLGAKDKDGARTGQDGRTGIGLASGVFRPGNAFQSANIIQDRGERMRFLMEQRDRQVASHTQLESIQQRKASVSREFQNVEDKRANIDEHNYPAKHAAEEKIKQLKQQQETLAREEADVRRRMNQEDLASAAKLLQAAQQRAKSATERFKERTKGIQGEQERLGMMNPLQFAAMVNARKKADGGKDLNRHDIELLDQGDERSKFLAAEAKRKMYRENVERNPGAEKFFSVEERRADIAGKEATHFAEERDTRSKELSTASNQVVVGGDVAVTVDLKGDMQIEENLQRELEGIFTQAFNDQILVTVQKAVDSATGRINSQRGVAGR